MYVNLKVNQEIDYALLPSSLEKLTAEHLLYRKHQHFMLSYTSQFVACNLTLLLNSGKIEFVLYN